MKAQSAFYRRLHRMLLQKKCHLLTFSFVTIFDGHKKYAFFHVQNHIFFLILCHPNMTTLLYCIWILYVAYYTFDLVVRFIKFANFRGICKMTRYNMNIKLLFLASLILFTQRSLLRSMVTKICFIWQCFSIFFLNLYHVFISVGW